jgi:hypothetical protein
MDASPDLSPPAETPPPLSMETSFALLFALQQRSAPAGDLSLPPPGLTPVEPAAAREHLDVLAEVEQRILGQSFQEAERVRRTPVGTMTVAAGPGAGLNATAYLVTHTAGVALFEVWLEEPAGRFDADGWIARLRPDTDDGVAAQVWRALLPLVGQLGAATDAPELYLPLSILRVPDQDLETVLGKHGEDLVRLLNLDVSGTHFKRSWVEQQLAQDFCLRAGGLSLISRRGALDLHARGDDSGRASLPLLVTLELLGLERSVLRMFLGRLAGDPDRPLDELLDLKQEALDGLEEYYGTLATSNAFSVQATAAGKSLLGLDDLYGAVVTRLDMVSFAVTTRLQKRLNLIGFWIVAFFGAIQSGLFAATIASSYKTAWFVGVALATGVVISVVLARLSKA